MALKNRILLSLLIMTTACALPPSTTKVQEFVPEKDLNVVSLTREGLDYYSRSRFIDAEFKFRAALEIVPDAKKIKFNLASTLIQEGNFKEAEEILESLLSEEKDSTQYLTALAQLYIEQHNYQLAIQNFLIAYETALDWKEFEAAGSFARSLAVLYFTIGQETEAINYSHSALSLIDTVEEMCKHAKLITAVGHSKLGAQEILVYINDKETKNACLLQELSMSALANGNNREASKYSEMGLNSKRIEPVEVATLQIIQDMTISKEDKQEGSETDKTTSFSQKLDEDFFKGNILDTPYTLYWPYKLLEYIEIIDNKDDN